MKKHRYCIDLLGTFTAKDFKKRDNKIICLNILNRRLLENDPNVLELWDIQDIDRLIRDVAKEFQITSYQASEELKLILRNDKEFWRKDYEKITRKINK